MDTMMAILLFFAYAALVMIALLALLFWWIRPYKISPDVPGPKRHWLLGVTFEESGEMISKSMTDEDGNKVDSSFDWAQWPTLSLNFSRNFGNGEFGFQTWGGPTINLGFGGAFFNVVSPRCFQYITRDNFDNYVKSKLVKSFEELFGTGVFTTDGEEWRFHRKMVVAGLLDQGTVKHAAKLLSCKLNQVESYLNQHDGELVDIQDVAYKAIFDVFVELAFGVELNQLTTATNPQEDDEDQVFSVSYLKNYADAFEKMQLYVHLRFNDFFWEIKQKFHFGERERNIVRCQKVIDDFAYSVIRNAKQAMQKDDDGGNSTSDRKDMISRYLTYCQDNAQPEPSDKNLRDMIMTLSLAGRDTTAVSIAWALYELTKHPVWIDKIRDEVDVVCGRDEDTITFDVCTSNKLPIVHAVVMETLRMYSPAPDNFRFAVNDDVLPDGTFIPAGSLVMFSAYTINHSEHVWGAANADEFDPSRWIDRGEPSPFEFPSFHAGPRMCPGKRLAMMELKMALAFLVSRFDFEDVDGHDGSYRWTLVLSMKGGFPVRISKRKS